MWPSCHLWGPSAKATGRGLSPDSSPDPGGTPQASGKGESSLGGPSTHTRIPDSPLCLPHCPPEFLPARTGPPAAPVGILHERHSHPKPEHKVLAPTWGMPLGLLGKARPPWVDPAPAQNSHGFSPLPASTSPLPPPVFLSASRDPSAAPLLPVGALWDRHRHPGPEPGTSGKGELSQGGPSTHSGLAVSSLCLPQHPPEFLSSCTGQPVDQLLDFGASLRDTEPGL